METLIVNKRGQITLPAELRKQRGLLKGSQLRVSLNKQMNTLCLVPLDSTRDCFGVLPKPDKALSIEEMNSAMETAVAEECSGRKTGFKELLLDCPNEDDLELERDVSSMREVDL